MLIAVDIVLAAIALAGLGFMIRRWRTARRRPAPAGATAEPPAGATAEPPAGSAAEPPARRRLHGCGLLGFAIAYGLGWAGAAAAIALDRRADGHPAPWLHAPTTTYMVAAIIAAGLALPLAWAAARWLPAVRRGADRLPAVGADRLPAAAANPRPAAGADRFLAAAIVLFLLAVVPLVLLSAPELALRPLASAALLGAAARFTRARFALPLAIAGLIPPLATLDPSLAREGFFHDFLAVDFPLAPTLAALLAPTALVAVWAWQRWGRPLPRRGRAILAVTALPLAIAGLAATLLVRDPPSCSGANFARAGLYCELTPDPGPASGD